MSKPGHAQCIETHQSEITKVFILKECQITYWEYIEDRMRLPDSDITLQICPKLEDFLKNFY